MFTFYVFLLVSLRFRFLCIPDDVGCCCKLDDGLALSFVLMSAIFIR
jgi:hypothetical protein